MNLRISATYAATGRGMPESVEIEWTDMAATSPDVDTVQTLLGMLLCAPSTRVESELRAIDEPGSRATDKLGGGVYERCLRCNHYRDNHGPFGSAWVGPCRLCPCVDWVDPTSATATRIGGNQP